MTKPEAEAKAREIADHVIDDFCETKDGLDRALLAKLIVDKCLIEQERPRVEVSEVELQDMADQAYLQMHPAMDVRVLYKLGYRAALAQPQSPGAQAGVRELCEKLLKNCSSFHEVIKHDPHSCGICLARQVVQLLDSQEGK